MAQLLDSTVTGDLNVSGNITVDGLPLLDNHVVTKGYIDNLNTFYTAKLPPIGSNSNGAGSWKRFCSVDFGVDLPSGTYLVNVSCTFSAIGSGLVTSRLLNNGSEIDSSFMGTRQTIPCTSQYSAYQTSNVSFLFTLDTDTSCVFRPEAYGTVTWTGRLAEINIIRVK